MRNPGPTKVDPHNHSRDNLPTRSGRGRGCGTDRNPIPVEPEDTARALRPDILILLELQVEECEMSLPENSSWKTRLVERGFPDRSFDIEFWQEQGDEAIFAAAWEMVELAEEINHGRKPTLQRTATTLKRIRS
jgi:hypothetical protein